MLTMKLNEDAADLLSCSIYDNCNSNCHKAVLKSIAKATIVAL